MKHINADLYQKIINLNREVKEELKQKGLVVPKTNSNGHIIVGRYKILKNDQGFFNILDYGNEIVIENINLPQSAALLANKLALGKFIDFKILTADRKYGHALFDEEIQLRIAKTSIKKNNLDRADLMFTKLKISRYRKEAFKKEILGGFEKLIKMR
jgi:hypothetical protein